VKPPFLFASAQIEMLEVAEALFLVLLVLIILIILCFGWLVVIALCFIILSLFESYTKRDDATKGLNGETQGLAESKVLRCVIEELFLSSDKCY